VRTIALEEHFWTAELAAPPGTGLLATWGQRVDDQLRDLGLARLADIWVTTSGLFSLPPVLCAVQVLGVDRVLFSVDYPFGGNAAGRALLDALPLAPADKAKIAGGNAERVLGLKAVI
jgi:hypothetical protein